mmetsp:Transcript_7768/g.16625  ORF Transcript_7768/g.16625 Transcript_7768/m.16625 type:complete len:414 (+) Transcript_7768:85-1326(+)
MTSKSIELISDDDFVELQGSVIFLSFRGCETSKPEHVTKLDVRKSLTLQSSKILGSFIQNSRTLKKINLSNFPMTSEDISVIFERDGSYNCPLEEIKFPCIGDDNQFTLRLENFRRMLQFVKSFPTLEYLSFYRSNLSDYYIEPLVDTLESMHLEELNMQQNILGIFGMELLLQAECSKQLKSLKLSYTTQRDIDLVAGFLSQDGNKVRQIYLEQVTTEPIDSSLKERLQMLLESIPNSSLLERLGMGGEAACSEEERKELASLFQQKVCDLSSFDALCQSNHHLYQLGFLKLPLIFAGGPPPVTATVTGERTPTLCRAMGINKAFMTTIEKIRCKLFTFYFRGKFDLMPFIGTDSKVMPHILHMMGKIVKTCVLIPKYSSMHHSFVVSGGQLDNMYRFVRDWDVPTLFGHTS